MQLITAKCPDCGADLKIPEGSLSVTCEYCGSNILVSEILGSNSVIQNCMTLAYASMQDGNFKDAYDHFNAALENDISNSSAWFGKATCIGMFGRIGENSFGEMINYFENAFKNAPADKQANLRKNAAAEIVKVIRHNSENIKMGCMLFSFDTGTESSLEKAGLAELKNKVMNTILKAQEYDPASNDVKVLLMEANSGAFFEQNPGLNQQIHENFNPEPLLVQTSQPVISEPLPAGPVYGKSKYLGCTIASIVIIVGAIVALSLFNFGDFFGGDKSSNNNKPALSLTISYTYSVVKLTEADNKLYVALYTDAVEDTNLLKITDTIIKKYSGRKKPIVINYYSNKSQAEKYDAVQFGKSEGWILKNASSIDLKLTSEYDNDKETYVIYRYVNGKKKYIDEPSNVPEPPSGTK